MPELPEVESLRLSLIPFLLGKSITQIQVNNPKLISGKGTRRQPSLEKSQFIQNLTGEVFHKLERRGKNLIFTFQSGKILLIHLKMTGQLIFQDQKNIISGGHPLKYTELPNSHTHLIFTLNKGILYYNDLRQFGYILYHHTLADFNSQNHFQNLGPEPFSPEFTLKYFQKSLNKTSSKIKTTLLSQKIISGLGNIYADEVCYKANIHPSRSSASLTQNEIKKLYSAIKNILTKAITKGGTSISDYLHADGSKGNYARYLQVYGRKGQNCQICQETLKSFKLNGRTTVYCPHCQK